MLESMSVNPGAEAHPVMENQSNTNTNATPAATNTTAAATNTTPAATNTTAAATNTVPQSPSIPDTDWKQTIKYSVRKVGISWLFSQVLFNLFVLVPWVHRTIFVLYHEYTALLIDIEESDTQRYEAI